ncbi:MAG: TIGR00341 family protein [Prevotella sp.]|nr:TIGR00341 family protein [Prevotella sp.]
MSDWKGLWARVRERFDLMPDREKEQDVIEDISREAVFKGANLWVLIFAIFIASLGLNVNSTAVIIGAMLISPLMGPIIGMGLAVGINDLDLLRRSFKNYAIATGISILTATVYFLLTPFNEVQSELLARTQPTLYDVMIAFLGGAAGIVALCSRGKGNVIPGVAIATALMPPLCTAGFGLATGRFLFFIGAFYLFFINTVFIALATVLGVHLMKFHPRDFISRERALHAKRVLTGIIVVTMLPAALMTYQIVRTSIFNRQVAQFVANELQQKGTQILQMDADREGKRLQIVAIGREITDATKTEAERHLAFYGLSHYELRIIQGAQTDSLMQLNSQLAEASNNRESAQQKLLEMSAENNELSSQLNEYTRYELLSVEIRSEMAALFPQVKSVSLSNTTETSRDTTAVSRFVSAIITTDGGKRLTPIEHQKLATWLKARVDADSLVMVEK